MKKQNAIGIAGLINMFLDSCRTGLFVYYKMIVLVLPAIDCISNAGLFNLYYSGKDGSAAAI